MSLLPLVLSLACTPDPTSDTGTEPTATTTAPITGELSDCDPLVPTMCGLPFPSTFFMREDATSQTGWRVALGATTLPISANKYQPDPWIWNERDGWSILGSMLVDLPGVSLTGVAGHDDISASIADSSLTIIVDAETGERVPHFVELDMSQEDADERLLMIRPVEPMGYGRSYVVGLRGLVDDSGAAIAPSEAFTALRDDAATEDYDIEGRRERYDSLIFPALEAQGWSRDETQLAWDFITASQEGITGRARWMRDDALERVAGGVSYTVDTVEEEVSEAVHSRIYGTLTAPLYTELDDSDTLLTRDADSMPYYNGDTEVPFTIVLPRSVVEAGQPAPLIQYGHGLLGGQGEVGSGYLGEMANEQGFVLFAVDWTGMKEDDVDDITLMLVNEIDRFAIIPERTHQGFVEFAVAMEMMITVMVDDPHLAAAGGGSLIDPDRRYYYGNSQGAILGGAYAALSTRIERATLGVGGAPYELLLTRSADFDPFFLIFQTMYPDPREVTYWLGLMQVLWDSGETAGYALSMNSEPLPDTPAKEILIQNALGDAQVSTLGGHVMARAFGAALIEEPVREVWGMETVTSGHSGSALVEWDYGVFEPFESVPPDDDTDTHENPRREKPGQEQMAHFFATGEVIHTCDGPCVGTE